MRPNMNESLTPVPIEEVFAGLCDKTDAAWQLGHELMQPMPPGWYRSHNELEGGRGWSVLAIDAKPYYSKPWPERQKYCSQAEAIELAEAHRLCREQAWAKHKKNTGGI